MQKMLVSVERKMHIHECIPAENRHHVTSCSNAVFKQLIDSYKPTVHESQWS